MADRKKVDQAISCLVEETRCEERLFFRSFPISSLAPQVAAKPFPYETQHLPHVEGSWPVSVTRVYMRIAFKNMNKSPVLSARKALANVGQEFWRTSGAIRRITGRMDTGFAEGQ